MPTLVSLVSWIIVGAIGGWLAGYALKRDTTFNLKDVILGMIGAIVGGWLVRTFMAVEPEGISPLAIIAAFVGALIVAFVYEKVTGKSVQ